MMTSSDKVFEVSRRAMFALAALPMLLPVSALAQTAVTDPLPSWNDTATKKAIATFVERVTKQGSPDFVPPAERIATFDNDGTLWAEQPIYFQLAFALDRIKVLAPQHPEWKDKEPFASLLKGDLKGALAGGEKALLEIVMATHSGSVRPERVIGSSGKQQFEMRDGKPVLVKLPAIDFIDDKDGKPIAIGRFIGRRPLVAFGNSDGDLQMLQWTVAGPGARFALIVHHTDAAREFAYDRESSVGRLDKGLDEPQANGWTVVDMKNDWKTIFPPVKK